MPVDTANATIEMWNVSAAAAAALQKVHSVSSDTGEAEWIFRETVSAFYIALFYDVAANLLKQYQPSAFVSLLYDIAAHLLIQYCVEM